MGAVILGWLLVPVVIVGLLVLVLRLGRRAARAAVAGSGVWFDSQRICPSSAGRAGSGMTGRQISSTSPWSTSGRTLRAVDC